MNRYTLQYYLTTESIIAYAQSIEAPVQKAGGVLIAPSTMPVTFWNIADVPWLDKEKTLIHGRQSFAYEAPLKAGSRLVCELALTKVEKKVGRSGALTLYTHILKCICRGELIVTVEEIRQNGGEDHGGDILLMTSTAGLNGSAGQVNYSAAKAGMLGMVWTLAEELRSHHIRINAVAPAALTDMTRPVIEHLQEKYARRNEPTQWQKPLRAWSKNDPAAFFETWRGGR